MDLPMPLTPGNMVLTVPTCPVTYYRRLVLSELNSNKDQAYAGADFDFEKCSR